MSPPVTLTDIAERIDYGHTASSTHEHVGPTFLRIADIQDNAVDWSRVPFCQCPEDRRERYRLLPGDLVFARTGATTGKSFLIRSCPTDTVFASYLIRVRPNRSSVDPVYLSHFFDSPGYWRQIISASTGSAQAGVNASKLKQLKIPLPPLPEQERIASILDKADAVRRKRARTLELADEFLKSTFLEMFGDIAAKKSKHPFGTIRQFVTASSGKSSKAVRTDSDTGIPIYGGNGQNGWASEALHDEPVVAVGRVGQQCGITTLVEHPCWVTDNAIVVKIMDKKRLNAVYLATALQMSPLRNTVQHLDLPFINQSMLLDYGIPLPGISLQKRYADLRAQTVGLSGDLQAISSAANDLFGGLVQRAFRGEL
ncbi:MAG: hypothetical protein HN742_12315 [Lentisphaerae bacterium]|jgi:type I restriction enzyme, S subunit|nr:hypothetical protein [Lentisphaerota bacterium]MBT4823180.1 hypothetical protein [Lentisphaerota bacterium]MBT5607222.1 hypothetical protein [Lentisphaerota bacterium]MBT7054247.1 hypothetical protein [Lentisphaerota bacterium]MBT7842652.1 hypothetical protein [Lentisphaerota bacterium]